MKLELISLFCCVFLTIGKETDASSKRLVLEQGIDETVATLLNKVKQLEAKVQQLEGAAPTSAYSSTYTRWGSFSCPGNGSDLLYKGYMAGKKWDTYGGGANFLCLPDNPNWGKYVDGTITGGIIYGVEMENNGNPNLLSTLFGSDIFNQDMSCAVCRTTRSHNVMIPGRATCYDGYTLEYQGYIVSSSESYQGTSEFVCLDSNIDPVPHGSANDDLSILYVVDVDCTANGGLPCPPYVGKRQLSCAVCSQ